MAQFEFAFVLSAIWWAVFTIPFMKNLRQTYALPRVDYQVKASLKQLWHTLRVLPKYPALAGFLIAYFFYIDGVNTIFTVA